MESTLDCGLEGTGAGVSFFTSLSSQWLAPPLDTAADEKRAPSVIVKFVSIKVKLRIVAVVGGFEISSPTRVKAKRPHR